MVVLRAQTIKDVNAHQVATDFTTWCKRRGDCLYKGKRRKFHGWLNLDRLKYKNQVAQCGYDDGDCNHTTHYGIGGYHNVCPIAGMNGDFAWPAKLQFSNFQFDKNGITSTAKIKEIKIHFEHRMVAVDTGSGRIYDNFGPNFHNQGDWAVKIYFTTGNNIVSTVKKHNSNPRLSKKNFNAVKYTFTDVSIDDLIKGNFALNIEYNHNFNTNPGIIYIRNVVIDVQYEDAKKYIEGSNSSKSLYTSNDNACVSTITQTIEAGYKNGKGKINPNKAPAKLGSKIQCIKKPNGVTVREISSNDLQKRFEITDKSQIGGNKTIYYNLRDDPKQSIALSYNSIIRKKPSYSIVTEYKSNEDFNSSIPYIVFKNGCAQSISIYVDSLSSSPITLTVANQNSTTNLLNASQIQKFHTAIKGLTCGYHTLYIKRGNESNQDVKKNKVIIRIKPMEFKFNVYTEETVDGSLNFIQNKNGLSQYSTILIERIDDEPQESIPSLSIFDETNYMAPSSTKANIKKGDIIGHLIDKYYAGDFYLTIQDNNSCKSIPSRHLIHIESHHKQNYDYLFTRGEDGTPFDFDYLVAWEGDNIKEPLYIDSITLKHSSNDLRICADSVQAGLSQIGFIDLKIKNKTNEIIEGVELELNTLIEEDETTTVTTKEWTDPDGIFNQFYTLFFEYNQELNNNVEILNLTPDNDLVDEENVFLFIKKIDKNDSINIRLPFRSTVEKEVLLQLLLFEEPLSINSIANCNSLVNDDNNIIRINVYDSMLTNLEIFGNTDLLVLDQNYDCPTECYTTKDTDDEYTPISDEQSGGITYKITNIDSNNFEGQSSRTEIINDIELQPYGYIVDGQYYALLDNNGNKINVQENRPVLDENGNQIYEQDLSDEENPQYTDIPLYYPNKIEWIEREEIVNKIMIHQNIYCTVNFPSEEEISYAVKTDKNGLANFFIPIPETLNRTYTIVELLSEVLMFEFKEQDKYNKSILTLQSNTLNYTPNPNKNTVILDYADNYRRYHPGEIANIPIFVSANIRMQKNYFIFNAELGNTGDSDEVTILYKICNIKDNEGIFTTKFKTNDIQLIPNEVSKKIYCGMDTDIKIEKRIEKKLIESQNINVLSLDLYNGEKENKDILVRVDLGQIPPEYLGDYDFIDITMENGDYSIINENDNIYVDWLIGEMDSFEKNKAIIKIKAQNVGLSNIKISIYDYLHQRNKNNITIKNSKCPKCEENTSYRIANSPWKEFDGIWYKRFEDGKYKRKTRINNETVWVDKE